MAIAVKLVGIAEVLSIGTELDSLRFSSSHFWNTAADCLRFIRALKFSWGHYFAILLLGWFLL